MHNDYGNTVVTDTFNPQDTPHLTLKGELWGVFCKA